MGIGRYLVDLAGTFQSLFQIGAVALKDNSSILEARNEEDTTYIPTASSRHDFKATAGGKVELQAPAALAVTKTFTLPIADGSTGDVLSTDGLGNLSFVAVATGANQIKTQSEQILFGTSSPIIIFTPPNNSTISKVIVDVDIAFNGTTPLLSVGISGDTTKYMNSTENKLKKIGSYEVTPNYQEDGTPDQIIITFVSSGSSAGQCQVTIEYSNPA
jgi:hypothetical protein